MSIWLGAQNQLLEKVIVSLKATGRATEAKRWSQLLSQTDISQISPKKNRVDSKRSPVEDFEVQLFDGSTWKVKDNRGKIVCLLGLRGVVRVSKSYQSCKSGRKYKHRGGGNLLGRKKSKLY